MCHVSLPDSGPSVSHALALVLNAVLELRMCHINEVGTFIWPLSNSWSGIDLAVDQVPWPSARRSATSVRRAVRLAG